MIDPFTLNPAGVHDRLLSYFFITWSRIQNYELGWPEAETAIKDLVGGTSYQIFEEIAPKTPRVDVCTLPGARALIAIRGTTMTAQLLAEIVGSGLITRVPWPGRVGLFFSGEALAIQQRIGALIPTQWIVCGHSMGGALAGLTSFYPASPAFRVFSIGAPREGDATYATARNDSLYLRLTNSGDPVCGIPLSTNTFQDELFFDLPIPIVANGFRHWGTRVNLWPDTSENRPQEYGTPKELPEFFLELFQNMNPFANHFMHDYAWRIRGGIPVVYPSVNPDADFPGLEVLDYYTSIMNSDENVEWEIDGRVAIPPRLPGFLPPRARPGPLEEPDLFEYRCE